MDLTHLRQRIDLLDEKIVAVLNERACVSLEIGKAKKVSNAGVYAPARERKVLDRVKALNKGPMPNGAFEAIYREVMSSSLSLRSLCALRIWVRKDRIHTQRRLRNLVPSWCMSAVAVLKMCLHVWNMNIAITE